jgi:hypothetical protein
VQTNQQSSRLLGRPLREIVGIRGEELVLERDRTENMTGFWTARSEEQPPLAKSYA